MEGEGQQFDFDIPEMDETYFTAAIESLCKNDEYIPPQTCERFLNQIEGLLTMHQEFVSLQYLPDIAHVKSLLPLDRNNQPSSATISMPPNKDKTVTAGEISTQK